MRGLVFCTLAATCLASAQDPTVITIEYDDYEGYGMAPLYAIAYLWPGCSIESFNGNPSVWADAVDSETSIAIGDMHNYALMDEDAFAHLTVWYSDPALGPMFYASWQMYASHDDVLMQAMGITEASSIQMPPIEHYLWQAFSPISIGITDWSYVNPGGGYGIGGSRLTVSTAIPVTGWTNTPMPGQAALCIANDGQSIVSGYFPSLNPTQSFALWKNILCYMWGSSSPGLTPMTWGSIKTMF
jgi:hypothetical protein